MEPSSAATNETTVTVLFPQFLPVQVTKYVA